MSELTLIIIMFICFCAGGYVGHILTGWYESIKRSRDLDREIQKNQETIEYFRDLENEYIKNKGL